MLALLVATAATRSFAGVPEAYRVSQDEYVFSARAEAGLGLGLQGGVEGEHWVLGRLGVGARAGGFLGRNFSEEVSAYGGGPLLALRTSSTGSYGLMALSVGVGHYKLKHTAFCLDFDDDGSCPPTDYSTGFGVIAGGGLGWLFHTAGVEIGPVLRIDVVGRGVSATLNLAVGFVLTD